MMKHISHQTNFLMQTIKLFILMSDCLTLTCKCGQENSWDLQGKTTLLGARSYLLNNKNFQLRETNCTIHPFYLQCSVCTPFLIPNAALMIISVFHLTNIINVGSIVL